MENVKEIIKNLPLKYKVMIADQETQNVLRNTQMQIHTIMIQKIDDKDKSKELIKVWEESTKILNQIWSDYFK